MNSITVKVARTGAKVQEVELGSDKSITTALSIAEVKPKASEIVYVNDEVVEENEMGSFELEDGDKIVLVKNIEGGKL